MSCCLLTMSSSAVVLRAPTSIIVIDLSSSGLPGLFETLISLVREQYRIHGRDPDAAGFEADRGTFTLRAPRATREGGDYYTVRVPGELLERADLKLIAEPAELPSKVLDPTDAGKTVDLLSSMPHGVLAMSPDIPGLVQTSTNLAIITMKDDQIEISTSQRSAIRSQK